MLIMKVLRVTILLFISFWLLSAAAAQTQSGAANPEEQIATTLGQLFMNNIRLNAQITSLQTQITTLTKENVDLRAKLVDPESEKRKPETGTQK
jgi:Skp family chaperone for outer membrane proteins